MKLPYSILGLFVLLSCCDSKHAEAVDKENLPGPNEQEQEEVDFGPVFISDLFYDYAIFAATLAVEEKWVIVYTLEDGSEVVRGRYDRREQVLDALIDDVLGGRMPNQTVSFAMERRDVFIRGPWIRFGYAESRAEAIETVNLFRQRGVAAFYAPYVSL